MVSQTVISWCFDMYHDIEWPTKKSCFLLRPRIFTYFSYRIFTYRIFYITMVHAQNFSKYHNITIWYHHGTMLPPQYIFVRRCIYRNIFSYFLGDMFFFFMLFYIYHSSSILFREVYCSCMEKPQYINFRTNSTDVIFVPCTF